MRALYALLIALLLAASSLSWQMQTAVFVWNPLSAQRGLLAAIVLAGYTLLCGGLYLARRQRFADGSSTDQIGVFFASQSGTAERIARRTAQALESAGQRAACYPLEQFEAATMRPQQPLLFVVSTSGEGDPPDHAFAFARKQMHGQLDLSGLNYAVLALGDQRYARFCAFGRALDQWLAQNKAQALFPRIEADNADAASLHQWQQQLASCFGDLVGDWTSPQLGSWRLEQKRHLNPGSPGAPIFQIRLHPHEPKQMDWRAGDIAEIEIPAQGDDPATQREYSIASIPEDGGLELVIRRVARPDGTLGRGSEFLTRELSQGQTLKLRVRENRSFHPPPDASPMILIGNGTGLAGLRAHLHARQLKGSQRNWLLFGERSRKHDRLFGGELDQALASGDLNRLDLAFSREWESIRYVQDALLAAHDTLREWIDDGAYIYVCGSSHGMAPGVAAALTDVVGQTTLDQLRDNGRYRSDVY